MDVRAVEALAQRVALVRRRIAAAAVRAGRDPADVSLVAVTKGVAADRIVPGVVTDVGENRVQELLAKQVAVGDGDLRWHFIGTLQRNKAARVVGRVALIHSVDSRALGESIARAADAAGSEQPVLVQVNTSGEATKHGVAPDDAGELAETLATLPGLDVRGFMTIAAPGAGRDARACFRALRAIRDAAALPGADELSMGMSGDLEVAVEEGATIVRVGTALFGPREGAGAADA